MLREHLELFSDNSSSHRTRKAHLLTLKTTIIPFLQISSSTLKDSADILAPIPSVSYVHKMAEGKKISEIRRNSCDSARIPLQMIQNSINNSPDETPAKKKQKTHHGNVLPTNISSLKPPNNGHYYTKLETLHILLKYPHRSRMWFQMITHLVSNNFIGEFITRFEVTTIYIIYSCPI